MRDEKRVAVLISGRGTNMRALVEQATGYEVVLVASNKPHAAGLDWARAKGLPTWTWDSKAIDREEFDRALSAALDDHRVGTVALAGFMRILSPWFIAEWRGRVLNIHPSLLPKYRGLDTHARAIAAGDSASGCSVHIVTEELDAGEVLGRAEVPILADDDAQSLEQRVLAAEHRLYPQVLKEFVGR
ncbi:MAG TPA: phosphoribosylglycinamide formyltransferase [Sphingomicrobium sp.]|nr:phosphoribosylglycinamide formyltransferase [Sphingomicrobium sp.]